MTAYTLPNISVFYREPENEALAQAVSAAGRWKPDRVSVCRRAVDARKKNDIRFVYTVRAEWDGDISSADGYLKKRGFLPVPESVPAPQPGDEPLSGRPVVVGFGPCGMFCALRLAEAGYRPIVIERGQGVEKRVADVARFRETGILDTESNVQFGAGGAGLFSDGKLTTRIGDRRIGGIIDDFVSLGAPKEIAVAAKPHIGTDRLTGVADSMDKRIRSLGGEILYGCRLDDIRIENGRAVSVMTSTGEIKCGAVILAVGHSARDTYSMLKSRGFTLMPKPFSVGVRIEHTREFIDRAMYGDAAGDPLLGAADYNFSLRRGEDAVYTFCMCPGGNVVAAASEEGGVVVNGMSRCARDGINSNSAIAVSVRPSDPVAFQRQLEQAAYSAGGGGYKAPVQTFGAFEKGQGNFSLGGVIPTYDGPGITQANLRSVFPESIASFLCDGIHTFGRKMSGYDMPDALMTGVESRTSAPYRMPRSERLVADIADNVYPAGEGAGWSGGIMSSAVDGVRCAEALIGRFAPPDNEV